jgi:hypothetical protein
VRRRRPRDRLRDANPVPLPDAPSPTSPQARATFERIVRSAPVRRRRAGRRRRYVLVLVPVVLVSALAAGYQWLRTAGEPLVVVCYGGPSLQARQAVVPGSDPTDVAACRALWRQGGQFARASRGSAPPLQACVLPTGAVGVFPGVRGEDPCDHLGLAHAGSEGADVAKVQAAVTDQLLARCVGRYEAVALVREELDRHGLGDWRIVVSPPFSQAAPCASVAVNVPRRTVLIVPVRNPATP